jgi:quercetin dioxygenase-like cupin family protein
MRLSFEAPEERRTIAGGRVTIDVVHVAGVPVLRVSHAPGWRWSEHNAPEVGVDRCPAYHVGVLVSGELAVEEADGTAYVLRPGDPLAIEPGHDAWTVGDEPAVLVQLDEGESAGRRFGLIGQREGGSG